MDPKSTSTPIVTLPGGQVAVDLFNIKNGGIAAIVDFNTLKRLAKHLPEVRFADVQDEIVDKIKDTRNLKDMINVMAEEVAFHKTVNLIDVIDVTLLVPAEAKKEEKTVGAVALT